MKYHPYRGHSAIFYPIEVPAKEIGERWSQEERFAAIGFWLHMELSLIIFGRT